MQVAEKVFILINAEMGSDIPVCYCAHQRHTEHGELGLAVTEVT